jgi:acyl carrier protein
MERKVLLEKVNVLIEDIASYPVDLSAGKPVDKLHLTNDIGLDSLELTQLIMSIEDEFGFKVADDEFFAKVKTVGDLLNFIEKGLSE